MTSLQLLAVCTILTFIVYVGGLVVLLAGATIWG